MCVLKVEEPQVQEGKTELEAASFKEGYNNAQGELERRLLETADTGSTSSDPGVTELTAALQRLTLKLQKQDEVLQKQAEELHDLKTSQVSTTEAPAASAPPAAEDSPEPSKKGDDPSFDAAKQRLRRMCKPRKDGSMEVAPNVLEEWNKKGTARTALVRLYMEKGCSKDS